MPDRQHAELSVVCEEHLGLSASAAADAAAFRAEDARKGEEERRFARPIGPAQQQEPAGGKREAQVREQRPPAPREG